MSLDNVFENRIKNILGDEYPAFEDALGREKVSSLRVNPLKKNGFGKTAFDSMEVLKRDGVSFSEKEIEWEKAGHIYTEGAPGKHAYHEAGVYYIQEPSAMSPVSYLNVKKGDKVLDLCASPGGKSTQIASMLGGEGILVSNEIDKKRAQILSLNIERCGIKNALVTNMDPSKMSDIFEGYFDKILVDAPCSGEGMFRKNDEAIKNWSPENVTMCAVRQAEILKEAVKMLALGGRLVYSTCTFAPEEDELQVINLVKLGMKPCETVLYPGMARGNIDNIFKVYDNTGMGDLSELISKISGSLGEGSTSCDEFFGEKESYADAINKSAIRLWPHKMSGEGHFLCAFEKDGDISLNEGLYGINGSVKAASLSDLKAFEEFVRDTFADGYNEIETGKELLNENSRSKKSKTSKNTLPSISLLGGGLNGRPFMFGSQLYLAPCGMPGIDGLTVVRPGLHLGTVKKDRFEPSHALALCLDPSLVKKTMDLPSNSQEVRQFIGGMTLRASGLSNGWHLITTDGYSLGWGKYAGGNMKNHYPKGLRIYN